MEKTLQEIMDQEDRKTWGPGHPDRRQTTEKILPVQRLKLVRDGSIRYNAPTPPITSPQYCLDIFRTHFAGATIEIMSALSVNMQNEFLNLSNVAYGTIGRMNVHPREIFKNVLAKDNAAKFILAHNHPSGNATPSPEDLETMESIRNLGIELGCRLIDFIIIGQADDSYYSHNELHYEYFAAPS